MMAYLRPGMIACATLVYWWSVSPASAGEENAPLASSPFRFVQFPRQKQPEQPKPRSYTDSGIVSEVTAQGISVVADKKMWLLRPQPGCTIEVTGEADPNFLKPGLLVRLYGDFDKKYKAVAPINRLEIVSPQTPNLTPGVFPDALPPAEEEEKGKEGDAKKAEEKTEVPAGAKNTEKASAEGVKPMMIVGTLKLVKDGEMLITAGNRAVRAPLADNATIRVSLSDFTLAKRGDAVKKFSCDYIEPGAGFIKLLTIELTNPLEGPKKPVRKPIGKAPVKAAGKAK